MRKSTQLNRGLYSELSDRRDGGGVGYTEHIVSKKEISGFGDTGQVGGDSVPQFLFLRDKEHNG